MVKLADSPDISGIVRSQYACVAPLWPNVGADEHALRERAAGRQVMLNDTPQYACPLEFKVAPERLELPTRGLGSRRTSAVRPQFALPARIAGVIVCR
jgi:hypothetical protein